MTGRDERPAQPAAEGGCERQAVAVASKADLNWRRIPGPFMRSLFLFLLPTFIGCSATWDLRDEDGDGKSILEGDCWDAPDGGDSIGPEAAEVWYDGIDQNCDGLSDFDQ